MHSNVLSAHRFFIRAGLAVGNVFAWVIIFHALYYTGESAAGALLLTALAYVAMQLLVFFLTPLSGANLRHGTARSMLCAVLAQAAGFLWLASAAAGVFGPGVINLWWGILGFVLLSALYRAFYWVPYKVAAEGSEMGWRPQTRFIFELLLALTPAAAATALYSSSRGVWLVFVGAAFFSFLAAIPLMRLRDSYERFDWNFAQTVEALFSHPYRKTLSRSVLEGIQGAGLLFVWPLTIFLLLGWSYKMVGLILSITFLIAILGRRYARGAVASLGAHNSPALNATLVGSSWALRVLALSPVSIIVADVIYHVATPAKRYGLDSISYEQAADSAHYIDEYSALKEMGMAIGRATLCLFFGLMLFFVSPLAALAASLIAAGAASLASVYEASRPRMF